MKCRGRKNSEQHARHKNAINKTSDDEATNINEKNETDERNTRRKKRLNNPR